LPYKKNNGVVSVFRLQTFSAVNLETITKEQVVAGIFPANVNST